MENESKDILDKQEPQINVGEKAETKEPSMIAQFRPLIIGIIITIILSVTLCIVFSRHTHEFGEWYIVTESTCTVEGTEARSCECGESEERSIALKEHSFKVATCTLPKICSICNISDGTPLGHTTDTGICDNCGKNFSSWVRGYYVDKFQNPTDKKYIKNICNGTSNNKSVYVTVWVDYNLEVSFKFSDYFEVSPYYPYDFCYDMTTIYVLDEKNIEHALSVKTYAYQDDISFTYSDRDRKNQDKFIELMKSNNILKICIKGWDYTYSFTLNTKGFKEAYDYLKNSK